MSKNMKLTATGQNNLSQSNLKDRALGFKNLGRSFWGFGDGRLKNNMTIKVKVKRLNELLGLNV